MVAFVTNDKFSKEHADFYNKSVNKGLFAYLLLIVPLLVPVLYRYINYGMTTYLLITLLLAFIIVITFIFRKRLHYSIKAYIILSVGLGFIVAGLIFMGLAGVWPVYITTCMIIAVWFFSRKFAIVTSFVVIGILLIGYYLSSINIIPIYKPDISFIKNPINWISLILIVLLNFLIIIFLLQSYHRFLINSAEQTALNEELIKTNDELQEAQYQLELSQNRYLQMFLQHNAVMLLINPENGMIADANMAAEKYFGYSNAEIKQLTLYNIIAHLDNNAKNTLLDTLRLGNEVVELEVYLKSGIKRYVEIHAHQIVSPTEQVIFAILHDISKRKAAENLANKYLVGIEQSPASVIITNKEGVIEFVNETFCKITGYGKNELIGTTTKILSSGITAPEVYTNLWETIRKGEVWHNELLNRRKDGSLFWESVAVTPVKNDAGEIINFLSVQLDINAKKEMLLKYEKSEAELKQMIISRDKFYAIISHDLRNPMNALKGLTELIMDSAEDGNITEVRIYCGLITEAVDKTIALLEGLLLWSKSQTNKVQFVPEIMELNTLVSNLSNATAAMVAGKKINIKFNYPSDMVITADKNILYLVLSNLLVNSIKFTKAGGNVWLTVKTTADYIIFEVGDSGIGIQPDKLKKLFELENITSTPGTENEMGSGLGLQICKEFIKLHNGNITVESTLGKGTLFTVSIPVIYKF